MKYGSFTNATDISEGCQPRFPRLTDRSPIGCLLFASPLGTQVADSKWTEWPIRGKFYVEAFDLCGFEFGLQICFEDLLPQDRHILKNQKRIGLFLEAQMFSVLPDGDILLCKRKFCPVQERSRHANSEALVGLREQDLLDK